jgi:hypothetical protein
MEQAAGILQRIMAETVAQTLKRLPPEELPQAAWDYAAGQAVAEKTRVLGCEESREGKTLRVEVADANWRTQLCAMAPQYVARLRPYLAVERIEFQLAGPAQPPQPTSAKGGQMWGTKIKKSSQGLTSQENGVAGKPVVGLLGQKGAHEGHRKGRSLRRRPGQS